MANKHGLKGSVVKKQAAARKLAKHKKAAAKTYIGAENAQTRANTSYKRRTRYLENKRNFPKKALPTKNVAALVELGIIDDRGFFRKGKKKNYVTGSMVDERGFDFYGIQRRDGGVQ